MPDISGAARVSSQLLPARSLQHARVRLVGGDCPAEVTSSRPRARRQHAPGDIEFSFLQVTDVLPVSARYRSSHSEGVDVIQGQQAAWPPHIQHGRTFVLGNEQWDVRWSPYGLCIRATVLPSPKGLHGNVLAMGCTRYPPRLSPPGIACCAKGGTADF